MLVSAPVVQVAGATSWLQSACDVQAWAVTAKAPPSAGHVIASQWKLATLESAPICVSPALEQPEPTHVPEGSATEQPRAAHSLASLAVHELPEMWGERCDGRGGVSGRWMVGKV